MIGSVVGTYTILAELGRGGMAVVYRARQARLERDVALKMMLPGQTTPELVARFENEAKVIGQFNHPHIIRLHVYDTYEASSTTSPTSPQAVAWLTSCAVARSAWPRSTNCCARCAMLWTMPTSARLFTAT